MNKMLRMRKSCLVCIILFVIVVGLTGGCDSHNSINTHDYSPTYKSYSPIPTYDTPSIEPLPTVSVESHKPIYTPYSIEEVSDDITVTVYVTRTGEKYHSYGCQYLSKSCIPIDLDDAISEGYTPCSRCHPPLG